MRFKILVLSVLFCLMLSCNKNSTTPEIPVPTPTPKVVTLTAVTVTSNRSSIYVDQTEQMTATGTMSDGTTEVVTGTWSSGNINAATVNQSGLVTGIDAGDTTIYCDSGGIRGSKKLAVKRLTPTAVTVTSNRSIIYVGQLERMTATVTMSDGTTEVATGTWGSRNTRVATVNQSGLVTGIDAGNVAIFFEMIVNPSGIAASDVTIQDLLGSKKLTVKKLWSRSGVGNNVFDMPKSVSRVRVIGTYTGYSSNFIVYVDGWLLVNELLGVGWGTTRYAGTHLTTGGVVEIQYSSGVSWSFTQVLTTTAPTMNTTRKITNIPSQSDPRYHTYEIYKRVAKGIK